MLEPFDLPKPLAKFGSGELEESYPEAHKAFLEDFACTIELVDFYVDAKETLWAFVGDGEAYQWQPPWHTADGWQSGCWMDVED